MELMGVVNKIRQDTFVIYEPLMFVAAVYMVLTFIFVWIFGVVEKSVPQRR